MGSSTSSQPPSLRDVAGAIGRIYRRGPDSLTNLSVYAFGVSGLWTAIGSVILQFRVLDIADESHKNGFLGAIALAGLAVAAITQPWVGAISDRGVSRWGKRLPFIVAGNVGLIVTAPMLGLANSFIALLIIICIMQVFGNASQGPANALLLDHIPRERRGVAAGALNLSRALGSGVVVIAVLGLMSNYEQGGTVWLWASLGLAAGVLFLTTLWTSVTLRPRADDVHNAPEPQPAALPAPSGGAGVEPPDDVPEDPQPVGASFYWFLIAMTMIVASLSAMQLYALFFIRDKVGLDNPAQGAAALVLVVGLATAGTVYPAGALSDRIGRMPVLYIAALLSAAGASLLIFIHSLLLLLVVGVIVGVGTGLFLSAAWALATDLVPERAAAKTLGLTGVATLIGSGGARLTGFLIDALNKRSENLGYDVLIVGVVLLLLFATVPLRRASLARSRSEAVRDDLAPSLIPRTPQV